MGLLDKLKQKQAENKVKQHDLKQTRGMELGHVVIEYAGGYDDKKRFNAKLCFYENQIEYSQFGKPVKGLIINASDVSSIEVSGQQQMKIRLTVTRMATLSVFSLAAPKRTTTKDASVVIGLKDGRQILFHSKSYSEFEVHSKLANAISYYHRLQVRATSDIPEVPSSHDDDSAIQIARFAGLKARGIITEKEFIQKKKQLLGL